jgi:hypothetical protein
MELDESDSELNTEDLESLFEVMTAHIDRFS